jgi:hypothetical protein
MKHYRPSQTGFVQRTIAGTLAGALLVLASWAAVSEFPGDSRALGQGRASVDTASKDAKPSDDAPPTDWVGPPVWPPYEKLVAVLEKWSGEHKEIMTLEQLGRSREGRPVYAVTLTDPKAKDDNKEHALVTALHSGLERSATTAMMAILEWLLSGDLTAREILQRQVVICLPVPDPDRYIKGEVSPIYGDWTLKGPRDPKNVPEAVFVQRLIDQFQPELLADIHGTNLDFERYIMFESSGTSYSNNALRPYYREIIRQMDEAALAEGFPSDTAESDAERIFFGPGLADMPSRCWLGRPRCYGAIYAYYHFHTIVSASEVGWDRSGVLRHRRLLQIGNERWPGEYYPGYPTRVILGNTHARLTAYGQTAAKRRCSRVELWNRLGEFTFGTLDPAVRGKMMCVLATSAAADKTYLPDPLLKTLVQRVQEHPNMNGEVIAKFAAGWPAGQNHPEPWLALQRRHAEPRIERQNSEDSGESNHGPNGIKHGACLRLRLPYQQAQITELRLNGHPLPQSETDGFLTWVARGCTYISVSLSPERLRKEDLFVVTCDYDPREKRSRWDYRKFLAE